MFNKETVSPPPATEKIFFALLFSIIFFAILMLPFAKFWFSKYPAGPFHSKVLLILIIFMIFSIVFGPISNIISSDNISFNSFVLGDPFKPFDTTTSSG